jgi:hypothetical protein
MAGHAYRVGCLTGCGTAPELMGEASRALEATARLHGIRIDQVHAPVGADAVQRHGQAVSHAARAAFLSADAVLVAAGTALLPVPATLARLDGRVARARSVSVREVVGPSIFWVGTSARDRLLVHLQGGDAAHRIVTGQRLDFTGVVARNPADLGAAWGLTRAEGSAQVTAQGRHLEVYAPRVRFACLSRCS